MLFITFISVILIKNELIFGSLSSVRIKAGILSRLISLESFSYEGSPISHVATYKFLPHLLPHLANSSIRFFSNS
jgi:hypothetical protein